MKKQLFTLALLTLGYVASSHSMAVAVMAHMNKINETMAPDTTQVVRGVNAYVVSQTPNVASQTVIRIEKIVSGPDKGKFNIISEDLGKASIVIEKKIGGHHPAKKVHYAKHDITVAGSAKDKDRGRVRDRDGLVVESIQSDDEGIEVDDFDLDSETKNSDSDMEMDAEGEDKDDVENDVE